MLPMVGDISEIPEAAATAAHGAAVARAAEPAHGGAPNETPESHFAESDCLNCGAALSGPYCRQCGQAAHLHRTIGAFFHDLLHGVLHFEGKIWRTLPLLVWRPGRLTREYIDGRRASYVSPIALFLFIVFLSFALFSFLGGSDALSPQVSGLEQARSAYAAGEEELAQLRSEQETLPEDSERRAALQDEIGELAERQQTLGGIVGAVGTDFERDFRAGFENNPLPEGNAISEAIGKVQANPQLAIYKAQTNAYKYSWMLIPLSVPFVWLLFPFSRRFAGYDHTVFTTYSITFMIALVAMVSLLVYFNLGSVGWLLLLYAPLHMYRQLRGTYTLGRWGALWRMLALSAFAWIAIGLFAAMMGLLTS
jgi:hypothetical protein